MEDFLEGTPEEQAENLLQDGWGRLVLWSTPFQAFIPNQANPDLFYKVHLITMECECSFPPYRGLCLHLHLALMIANKRAKEEGSETIEAGRVRIAAEAEDNRDYLPERLSLTTFHSDIICVTSLEDLSCTCKASFFGFECVGVVLCRSLNPNLSHTEPASKQTTIEYPQQPFVPGTGAGHTTSINNKDLHLSDPETLNAVNSLNSLSSQNVIHGDQKYSDKSSAKLIEDLFLWSQSPAFTDSPALRNCLIKIHADNHIALLEDGAGTRNRPSPDGKRESHKRVRNLTPIRESPRKSSRTSRHGNK